MYKFTLKTHSSFIILVSVLENVNLQVNENCYHEKKATWHQIVTKKYKMKMIKIIQKIKKKVYHNKTGKEGSEWIPSWAISPGKSPWKPPMVKSPCWVNDPKSSPTPNPNTNHNMRIYKGKFSWAISQRRIPREELLRRDFPDTGKNIHPHLYGWKYSDVWKRNNLELSLFNHPYCWLKMERKFYLSMFVDHVTDNLECTTLAIQP